MIRAILLAILLFALPAAAQDRVVRVGLLSNGSQTSAMSTTTWRSELLRVLAENGFNLNRNLTLVDRYSEGQFDRLPRLASEIAAAGVDVLVAVSDASVRAALAATAATPVVMVVGDDPIASGFISSYARPAGRVTGIFFQTLEGDAKRLQLLAEAIPSARRFGRLEPRGMGLRTAERIARAAAELRLDLTTQVVGGPDEYSMAFAVMRKEGAAGALITATQVWGDNIVPITAAAIEHGLPTICEWGHQARIGCVFGYGHDLAYAQRLVGTYVVRILNGASPTTLPVQESDRWQLVVNLRTARALGLIIPPAVLARADEVIE